MSDYYGYNPIPTPPVGNINAVTDVYTGNTYLHELCLKKAPLTTIRKAVQSLGASLSIANKKNMPPLGIAILEGNIETVAALIDMGSPLFLPLGKDTYFNAATLALFCGREAILKTVLEKGGDLHVNQPGISSSGEKENFHCLHLAIKSSRPEAVKHLLKAGALLEAQAGDQSISPLQLAASLNAVPFIKPLTDAGASLDQHNSVNGYTALHYAVLNNKYQAVEKLLELGADPNARDSDGTTPLMLAAAMGYQTLMPLLFKYKADPNIQQSGKDKETALILAARKGSLETVSTLLAAGANPLLANAFNKTASACAQEPNYGYVQEYSRQNIIKLLKEKEMDAEQKNFEKSYSRYKR